MQVCCMHRCDSIADGSGEVILARPSPRIQRHTRTCWATGPEPWHRSLGFLDAKRLQRDLHSLTLRTACHTWTSVIRSTEQYIPTAHVLGACTEPHL